MDYVVSGCRVSGKKDSCWSSFGGCDDDTKQMQGADRSVRACALFNGPCNQCACEGVLRHFKPSRMLSTPTGVLPCSTSRQQCLGRPQQAKAPFRLAARALPQSERTPGVSPEQPFINVIPGSQWPNGIPPVMGAHLMASGTVPPHMFTYPGEGAAQVQVYATPKAAAGGIAKQVAAAAEAAIKEKGSFTLVLSGGSLVDNLAGLAAAKGIQWDKWHVFWVDERNVPLESKDSNYRGAYEALLGKVGRWEYAAAVCAAAVLWSLNDTGQDDAVSMQYC